VPHKRVSGAVAVRSLDEGESQKTLTWLIARIAARVGPSSDSHPQKALCSISVVDDSMSTDARAVQWAKAPTPMLNLRDQRDLRALLMAGGAVVTAVSAVQWMKASDSIFVTDDGMATAASALQLPKAPALINVSEDGSRWSRARCSFGMRNGLSR